MNVVLIVIDSLRAGALAGPPQLRTPFLDRLSRESLCFRRAYATECWTLPAHLSMFTGLLPSQHGAHFQTMAYAGQAPTVAEVMAEAGYHTALVTRNFVFDGTIPGVTRGFQECLRPLAELRGWQPMAVALALAKPRVRQHVRNTAFFHSRHSDQRGFLRTFVRSLLPADTRALAHVVEIMSRYRKRQRPYFVFCNLYDVHAPYAPEINSLLRPWGTPHGLAENLAFPFYMAKLGRHAYLRDDFRISTWAREVLRRRYERAIELMDGKLAAFVDALRGDRLLDDTLLIITSDHGEGFGEHGLYLHDASVFDTHLHVPLWILHPHRPPEIIDDVVSTQGLFGVILAAAGRSRIDRTLLHTSYRQARPAALAEHFPHRARRGHAPRHGEYQRAVITASEKLVACGNTALRYDPARDPDELAAEPIPGERFASAWWRNRWSTTAPCAPTSTPCSA